MEARERSAGHEGGSAKRAHSGRDNGLGSMSVVTISAKFQVVIPREIREALGLRPGQRVEALQYGERVEFIPMCPVKAMRGFLKGLNTSVPRDRERV